MSEKLTEAKEDFEKCISLNDSFIPAKIQLAYSIYKSAALQQSPILAQGAVEMLQKTVEKYPDSADAHSLFAQVSLGLFSGIKFILHSAKNVLQYFELKCTNQSQRWPMLGLLWGRSQVDSTVRPIRRELK